MLNDKEFQDVLEREFAKGLSIGLKAQIGGNKAQHESLDSPLSLFQKAMEGESQLEEGLKCKK